MSTLRAFNLQRLQLGLSPFLQTEGQFTRLVNVDPYPIGAMSKRAGYGTTLNSVGGTVTSLWDWHNGSGTQFWNYAASGGSVYYSTQGTGNWIIAGNGTMTDNARIGFGVLEETMLIGDGTAASRHTTSGTDFTNTSAAPVAFDFQDYTDQRMYAIGSQQLFWSTPGTPTGWVTDSSSINIPGPGHLRSLMKVADRLVTTKNSGVMHRYDGYNLFDLSTKLGPSSPYSIGEIEDYRFYLNRKGYFGFDGNRPEIVSNSIRPQVYNELGSGIVGGTFNNAPAVSHKYDYMCAVGTVTDDFTNESIANCMQIYNYQLDNWRNYSMGTPVTAMWSYKDNNENEQLIFGDNAGQCYLFGGTQTTDNGLPIESIMEFLYHGGAPELDKKWNYSWLFFNPGCQAHVQYSYADTFVKGKKQWISAGDTASGVVEIQHTAGAQSKLLLVKITESSRTARFTYYGMACDYDPLQRR